MERAERAGSGTTVSEDPRDGELLRLERALAAAEAGCRQRDELLSIASHALRTPLTAILGWVNLLRASQLDAAASARALEVIERNARREAELIADLSDATRILAGRLRLNRGRVDLTRVVDEALAGVRASAEAKGVRLHATLDATAAPLSGDFDRLKQVVSILLGNAVKFSGDHGEVDVRLVRVGSFAELRVRDGGAGIPAALLPHLFDRLPHGEEDGPGEGDRNRNQLGLGLSIARHLADLHGGALSAASEGPGRGATLTLRLPLGGPEPEAAPAEEGGPEPPTATQLRGRRILLVADDEAARGEMVRALGLLGAEVATAGSSEQAMWELAAGAPDAMVVDLEMHDGQGYEFIGRARTLKTEEGRRTPAVALSVHGGADDRLRTLRAGFQVHVAKPAPAVELAAVLASLAAGSSPFPPSRGSVGGKGAA